MKPDEPTVTAGLPASPTDSQADLPTPQRMTYALVLDWGCTIAFACLLIAFGLYAARIVPPLVPLDEIPSRWTKSLEEFHREAGMTGPTETGGRIRWIGHLDRGEFVVYLPIACMSGISFFAYAVLLPFYVRRRSYALLVVAVLQLAVLAWAAWPGTG